ncbi:MAG: hypothetical protein Q7S21_06710 [archaeon]|nr:hypothetical protein [archaeon]
MPARRGAINKHGRRQEKLRTGLYKGKLPIVEPGAIPFIERRGRKGGIVTGTKMLGRVLKFGNARKVGTRDYLMGIGKARIKRMSKRMKMKKAMKRN